MRKAGAINYLLIAAAAALLFIPFLGNVHLFDWDEINFAECAREMVVTDNYSDVTINYQPFWEKPPLFIWMQAISMNFFGVNEMAARLPNAICGIVTLIVIFHIGRSIYDKKFGWLWALCYAGSFLPHFYFKSGIIDPWFNLFIFCGIYFFILFTNNADAPPGNRQNLLRIIFSALFIGLGIMTKGPVALLVFGLCFAVYWFLKRRLVMSIKQMLIYAAAVAAVGGLWFIIETLRGRFHIIIDFFVYQVRLLKTEDAGHGGPFYYHFLVLLIGCFPASIFAIRAYKKHDTDTPFQKHFKQWMWILFWVVLILFSVVQTKIVHYSSLCWFPLTYLGAYAVNKIMNRELEWKRWMTIMVLVIGGLVGTAIAMMPLIEKYKRNIIDSKLIADRFANANLEANVHWTGLESLVGILFVAALAIAGWMIIKKHYSRAIILVFASSLLMLNIAQVLIVPKVEKYSQGTAIAFFERLQDEDAYVETLGYKSYAYLFYSMKKPEANSSPLLAEWIKQNNTNNKPIDPKSFNELYTGWLLQGKIDKPAYFIARITEADGIITGYPQIKEFGRMNGFVFFVRPNN
jgi:4-amino-4-deoxy-L-arabinose transferase-like glycosyltransferase